MVVISMQESLAMCSVFFFFQAEDGIRDLTVTGVQTCALPICSEFCGTQHAWMHFLLVTDPQAEFQQWEQAQRAVLFRSLRRGAGIVVQNVSESSATLIAGFS